MRRRRKYTIIKIDPNTDYHIKKIITKSRIIPREMEKDIVYGSRLVTQLINRVMVRGKKKLAMKIVYDAMEMVRIKTREKPLSILEKAIDNIKPALEVRSRRVGGQNYQIPRDVTDRRKLSLAIRWLVVNAKVRKEKNMTERLANELIDASNFIGGAMKKREEVQKTAIANRAFSHFRW